MVGIATIPQQKRWVAVISNQNVSKAIVVEIGENNATPGVGCLRRDASQSSHFRELFSVLIVKQGTHLLVMRSRGGLLYFGIDVAIGNEQVEPAIIIIVTPGNAHRSHQMATG